MPTDRNLNSFTTITSPGGLPKVNSIFDFSADALAQLRLWLEQNPPAIGISNILGFSQFTANSNSVITAETTTSASYTDLATVGPTLTGLPDGQYIILYGAASSSSATGTQTAFVSVSVNGATAVDNDGAENQNNAIASVARAITSTLSNGGNNTITLKYRSTSGTATFAFRWLIALKFDNK